MHRYPEGVEGPRFWQKGCPGPPTGLDPGRARMEPCIRGRRSIAFTTTPTSSRTALRVKPRRLPVDRGSHAVGSLWTHHRVMAVDFARRLELARARASLELTAGTLGPLPHEASIAPTESDLVGVVPRVGVLLELEQLEESASEDRAALDLYLPARHAGKRGTPSRIAQLGQPAEERRGGELHDVRQGPRNDERRLPALLLSGVLDQYRVGTEVHTHVSKVFPEAELDVAA